MTRFLLIRHATNDIVNKRLAGRMGGVHLNEEGRAQAEKLAALLRNLPITAIYSSPLERAMETAEPLAQALHLRTIPYEGFLEIDLGQWTNCAFEDLAQQPLFQRFNTFRSCTRIPGGELMPEAQTRIIAGLEKLCSQHRDETVAVVSHSDMIKAAIAHYAGIHLDLFQRIEISPASVSIIEVYDETARILLLNHIGEIRF
jgi:probable phosphomutase (TIGR03848 family)